MRLSADAVPLPESFKGNWLYLVHTLAWAPKSGVPAGTIQVDFADGTRKDIPVVCGRDVEDWWYPSGVDRKSVV